MTSSRTSAVLAGVLLVAAVYLIARPYWGFSHDAQLYLAQALNREHPGLLANDLFFRYGSQDRFTIASSLYAPLIALAGPENAALGLTLAGAAFGLGCAFVLLRALVGAVPALLGTLMLASFSGSYAAYRVYSLLEPFATPRVWAMALVLLAMTGAISRQVWTSGVCGALAMAVHPLIALPGLAWIAFVVLRPGHLVGGALLMAGGCGAVTWLGIAPFDQLLRQFDPAWRQILETRLPYLFVTHWPEWDIGMAAQTILAAMLVAMRFGGTARRIFGAAAVIGGLGIIATVLGVDGYGNVLIGQLQPWRALWISTFAALAGLGILIARWARVGSREDAIAAAGIVAGLALETSVSALPAVAAMVLLFVYRRTTAERVRRWLLATELLILVEALAWYILNRPNDFILRDALGSYTLRIPGYFRDAMFLASVGSLSVLAWTRCRAQFLRVAIVASAALAAVIGAADWVTVYELNVWSTHSLPEVAEIRARLPARGSVYWEGRALMPWLVLGYPSYISDVQTAGLVFSRDTALEADRRSRLVEAALGPQLFMRWQLTPDESSISRSTVDSSGARKLCRDPELAGVFVPPANGGQLPGVAIRTRNGAEIGRFVFCSDIRGAT